MQHINEYWPEIGVVVLSMYKYLEQGAMVSGADAFVTKAAPPEVLLRILEAVAMLQEQQGQAIVRLTSIDTKESARLSQKTVDGDA